MTAAAGADVSVRADGLLAVSGELTFDTVPGVLARTAPAIETGAGGATIDLAGVARADSAGLALMIEWLRLARGAGRVLRFTRIPEQVREIIRVNGLSRAFDADNS